MVRAISEACPTQCWMTVGNLYKLQRTRPEVLSILPTCVHVAKVIETFNQELVATATAATTTAAATVAVDTTCRDSNQNSAAYWLTSWPHIRQLHELLAQLDDLCKKLFGPQTVVKQNKFLRLLSANKMLAVQLDDVISALRCECDKLERGILGRQLNRVTAPAARLIGQIDRSRSCVLADSDGKAFWRTYFGEHQVCGSPTAAASWLSRCLLTLRHDGVIVSRRTGAG
jgi:hypothetical protein